MLVTVLITFSVIDDLIAFLMVIFHYVMYQVTTNSSYYIQAQDYDMKDCHYILENLRCYKLRNAYLI